MAINSRKVLTGGLSAGLVLIVFNILAQFVLTGRVQHEMNAWIPGSADRITMGAGPIAAGIILKFVIGILLVWIYAAIRPRMGPGPRTASYAAIFVWTLGAIFFSDFPMMGMMSVLTYAILEMIQLVAFVSAIWVGARSYSE